MIRAPWARAVAALLALLFLVNTGCAGGWKTLSREDLVDPKPARSYRVTTRGGETLTFISLALDGESLGGTVRRTVTSAEGEGEEARAAVTNLYEEHRMPWVDVERVEGDFPGSKGPGWLLPVGAIGVGIIAFLILSDTATKTPPSDGGKSLP